MSTVLLMMPLQTLKSHLTLLQSWSSVIKPMARVPSLRRLWVRGALLVVSLLHSCYCKRADLYMLMDIDACTDVCFHAYRTLVCSWRAGFQFNHVGGGTKTRRPITLHMKYNSAAVQPACFLMTDDAREREVTLEELQACMQHPCIHSPSRMLSYHPTPDPQHPRHASTQAHLPPCCCVCLFVEA
jgi:hypothetical protein